LLSAYSTASTVVLSGSLSSANERLITLAPWSAAQRMPSLMASDDPLSLVAIRTGGIFARGATPRMLFAPPPLAAMMPAMPVPWPSTSAVLPAPRSRQRVRNDSGACHRWSLER
jgi:hypothetical protein